MIGDWVYAIDGDEIKRPCRIATLEYDSTNKRDDFSIDFYGTDYEVEWPDVTFEVEPIPLTAEILEKNGARKSLLMGEQRHFTYWLDGLEILAIYDADFSFQINGNARKLKYVHELQHALKLCGIEKEIEL